MKQAPTITTVHRRTIHGEICHDRLKRLAAEAVLNEADNSIRALRRTGVTYDVRFEDSVDGIHAVVEIVEDLSPTSNEDRPARAEAGG